MIDLHCHMLPDMDDGAPDLAVALAMARCAVADGIQITACTPHIYPGLYENTRSGIATAVTEFQHVLNREGIPLTLITGADAHLAPDLLESLRSGIVPTLNDTRYLLLEPPHHVMPPRFEESVFQLAAAGYVPVITHPERLTWIEQHYVVFQRLADSIAWMQVTAGSLTGRFGRRPKYWAERMLDEGRVHILATDSHHIERRAPLLSEGRDAAAVRVGELEAFHLVDTRPRGILADKSTEQMPGRLPVRSRPSGRWERWLARLS